MKTLRFIFVALMTLFSVNSFSQTTHTFTLDNTDWVTTGSAEVQVGDVINFVNGYASTTFWGEFNGQGLPGYPMTVYLNQSIYSYTVTDMTPFTIKVSADQLGVISEQVSFTVTESTANIDENTLTYNVYPNPTSDVVTIQTDCNGEIQVFDIMGNMVMKTDQKKITVSSLPKGIYFIRMGLHTQTFVVE